MEKHPELEKFKEESFSSNEKNAENALPYLKEEKTEIPKDYDVTIQKLTAQLEQAEPDTKEGKGLFIMAFALSVILLGVQVIELLGYPKWLDWLHHLLIFTEATIPFATSFFLKNNKFATLMRLIGIIVILVYLFTLYFNPTI